jgi:hypothetical protein
MEETLYDISGNPVAYIDYDSECTVYMWSGKPVAYITSDMIYGFNGKHLGWYVDGVVRNLSGQICGTNRYAATVYLKYEPYKAYKQYRPYRAFREFAHFKPLFTRVKSNESLSQVLSRGV